MNSVRHAKLSGVLFHSRRYYGCLPNVIFVLQSLPNTQFNAQDRPSLCHHLIFKAYISHKLETFEHFSDSFEISIFLTNCTTGIIKQCSSAVW